MPFLPLFLLLGIRRVAARVAVAVWFVPIEISFIEMSVILISMFDAVPPPCGDKLTSYQGKRMCGVKKPCVVTNMVCVCARGAYFWLLAVPAPSSVCLVASSGWRGAEGEWGYVQRLHLRKG